MGLVFIAAGAPAILSAVGAFRPLAGDPSTPPPWVIFAIGLMFIAAGLAVILDYTIAGGLGPDGDFKPDTPFAIRVANFVLGIAILGLMVAVFGWVAFGGGPRRFSMTISLPFVSRAARSSDWSGRVVFGGATVLLAAMFIASSIVGAERLWRARQG